MYNAALRELMNRLLTMIATTIPEPIIPWAIDVTTLVTYNSNARMDAVTENCRARAANITNNRASTRLVRGEIRKSTRTVVMPPTAKPAYMAFWAAVDAATSLVILGHNRARSLPSGFGVESDNPSVCIDVRDYLRSYPAK
jgi:maltose-binding protein MalE